VAASACKGEGLTVATFRHRTSRAGDPQLHTHAVVANRTVAAARATALDGQALYAHARTAGFLYQAALRHELTRAVGLDWEPVTNGVAEIRGIEQTVLRHFSRRSEEIRRRMAERGGRTARSAQTAALETRRAKTYDVPVDYLRADWRARAAEMGLDRDQLAGLLDSRLAGFPRAPDIPQAAATMTAPGGITRQASTFDRRDVLRDWAEAHREGAPVATIERLADAWLTSDCAVRLEHDGRRRHLGGARYSTPDMLRLEQRLLDQSAERKATGVARVDPAAADAALSSRSDLADEQAGLVRAVTTSGDGVQVIRAAAGTGKTHALAAARDLWEQDDIRVYGCALAARAAVELETLAGIDSSTIARLQHDLDHGSGLPRGSVLVVDEAGMVGTRAIARLADHCKDTDSKLLLVGDDHQLPELDAGGAFRGLAARLGATELRRVHRQADDWDREALGALRHGKVADWAKAYRDHGRLVARPTAARTREALVEDWWQVAKTGTQDAVMIAHRRVDVAELNSRARERMHEDRRLSDEQVVADGRAFAVGDRVIAKRNEPRLDIVNGTRGDIVAVDHARSSVDVGLADGSTRRLDAAYLEAGGLDHGYALTAHAAQGATVDRSFVLGSDDLYREWGYTALTRHRAETRFYVVSPGSVERALPGLAPSPDPLTEDVVAMLHGSRRKQLANEVLERGLGSADLPETPPSDARDQRDRRSVEAEAAAAAAVRRAQALDAERTAAGWLQFRRRAELDRLAGAQHEEARRWTERITELQQTEREVPHPLDEAPPASPQEVRDQLTHPHTAIENELGTRPACILDRDTWSRAAARLVSTGTTTLDPAPAARMMEIDDMGIEL